MEVDGFVSGAKRQSLGEARSDPTRPDRGGSVSKLQPTGSGRLGQNQQWRKRVKLKELKEQRYFGYSEVIAVSEGTLSFLLLSSLNSGTAEFKRFQKRAPTSTVGTWSHHPPWRQVHVPGVTVDCRGEDSKDGVGKALKVKLSERGGTLHCVGALDPRYSVGPSPSCRVA
jgi:hypothetical protein